MRGRAATPIDEGLRVGEPRGELRLGGRDGGLEEAAPLGRAAREAREGRVRRLEQVARARVGDERHVATRRRALAQQAAHALGVRDRGERGVAAAHREQHGHLRGPYREELALARGELRRVVAPLRLAVAIGVDACGARVEGQVLGLHAPRAVAHGHHQRTAAVDAHDGADESRGEVGSDRQGEPAPERVTEDADAAALEGARVPLQPARRLLEVGQVDAGRRRRATGGRGLVWDEASDLRTGRRGRRVKGCRL